MNEEKSPARQLGRGLSALFGEDTADHFEGETAGGTYNVPIEFLKPNRYQPRQTFDQEQIESLVASVKEQGILQPILVRRDAERADSYEIIAGERRWRAAQIAQLHEVPVVIRDVSDESALEIALVENIQRQDLNPLEEAEGYQRLMDEFSHTQEHLANAVGKSRSHVANTLRLLNLPDGVKIMLSGGELSAGHARALLNAEDPEALARRVLKQGLNVRQTERLLQQEKSGRAKPGRAAEKDPDTVALENDLSNLLGLKVSVTFRRTGGELVIHYKTLDQLDDVLHRLKHGDQPSS